MIDRELEWNRLRGRIERLERTNRVLMSGFLALAGAAIVAAAGGSGASEPVVQAEAFELVSSEGRVLGRWSSRESGPELVMYDSEQRLRIRLVHSNEETALHLKDQGGHTRIGIAQFAHGGGGVALHGPEGKGAAVLYLEESGSLTFYDEDGATIARTP